MHVQDCFRSHRPTTPTSWRLCLCTSADRSNCRCAHVTASAQYAVRSSTLDLKEFRQRRSKVLQLWENARRRTKANLHAATPDESNQRRLWSAAQQKYSKPNNGTAESWPLLLLKPFAFYSAEVHASHAVNLYAMRSRALQPTDCPASSLLTRLMSGNWPGSQEDE